jgi:hypothetical protein
MLITDMVRYSCLYEEYFLLECIAVEFGRRPTTFQAYNFHPQGGSVIQERKQKKRRRQADLKSIMYVSFRQKLNSVALVRKRTIPTELPPLVGEVSANFCWYRESRGRCNASPRPLISVFQSRSRYFSIQIAPQSYWWGWLDPVPDPLLLRKCDSAGKRTRDLWICSQELWP